MKQIIFCWCCFTFSTYILKMIKKGYVQTSFLLFCWDLFVSCSNILKAYNNCNMLNYPDYPDRLFINMDSKQLLELTPFHRITVAIMIVLQYALFFISQALLVHYFALPIPFVSFPSIATTTSTETHYLWNTFLHLLFWAQHILMATLMYKKAWFSRWKYFALYDRYVYNIISGIILILIVAHM